MKAAQLPIKEVRSPNSHMGVKRVVDCPKAKKQVNESRCIKCKHLRIALEKIIKCIYSDYQGKYVI